MRFTIDTPEQMEELGARIARQLSAGDVVALTGELGAGKTTLTRGLGHALGVRGAVASPTFVLARTHPRQDAAPLVHVDAYRLADAAELEDLDIDFEGSIVVVEWAEGMLDGVAESWLAVQIDRPKGATGAPAVFDDVAEPREVTITGHGPRWSTLTL
jgi:tRNA threonylcarbamoyladenosine biosynthesis protein TsaE